MGWVVAPVPGEGFTLSHIPRKTPFDFYLEFMWSPWSLCGLHLNCHEQVDFYWNSINTPTALHIDSNYTPCRLQSALKSTRNPESLCGVYLELAKLQRAHVEFIWSPPELQRAHLELIWSPQNSREPIWSLSQLSRLHPKSKEPMWSSPPIK